MTTKQVDTLGAQLNDELLKSAALTVRRRLHLTSINTDNYQRTFFCPFVSNFQNIELESSISLSPSQGSLQCML